MNRAERIRMTDLVKSFTPSKYLGEFRLNTDTFNRLVELQTPVEVPSSNSRCVFSTVSLQSLLDTEDIVYLSEAVIKTYPVDVMLGDFAKFLAKKTGANVVVGLLLKQRDVFFVNGETNEIMRLNASEDAIPGLRNDLIVVKLALSHVEDDGAAGRVDMEICDGRPEALEPKVIAEYAGRAHVFGYNFVACDKVANTNGRTLIAGFESKFQKKTVPVGRFIYHICPYDVVPKILKQGLVPKSKSSLNGLELKHDPQVYFLTRRPDADTVMRFVQLSGKPGFLEHGKKATVLKIDVSKVPGLKLYIDVMTRSQNNDLPDAVYSLDGVSPRAISIENTFTLG